ncbi:MAG: OsmC family protein [Anaerolineae bacterium]|nr:OsmC family protein [Anaerolineae bacterium]
MAKTVQVTWVEKRQFIGTDSSKHSVVMSSHDDENGTGMIPSQLLMVALGGCTSYDVVGILEKKRQKITGLNVSVTGEQDSEAPWAYRKIHVHYAVRGRQLKDKSVKDAIELSESKYCSVLATLQGVAEVTSDYEIIEDE